MERTWKPTAAGILCIIAGVVYVPASVVINLLLDLAMLVVTGEPGGSGEFPIAFAVTMWILPLVLAVIAVVGGIHALRRRRWGLALAGSICVLIPWIVIAISGIVILLPFGSSLIAAFIVLTGLALLPLISVILGRREFR